MPSLLVAVHNVYQEMRLFERLELSLKSMLLCCLESLTLKARMIDGDNLSSTVCSATCDYIVMVILFSSSSSPQASLPGTSRSKIGGAAEKEEVGRGRESR